jgi:hypothetical protein
VTRRLLILIGGTVALAALAVVPAQRLGGSTAVAYCVIACLMCLVPAAATLVISELTFGGKPEHQQLAFLGGTAVRMLFVALVTNILYTQVPFFQAQDGFILWVSAFYLIVLALETSLVASALSGRSPPQAAGATAANGQPTAND